MIKIKESIELSPYTTFKIGGKARYFGIAKNQEELLELLKFAKNKNLPFLILGKGSNVLISDAGFNGLAIINQAKSLKIEREEVVAETGISLAELIEEIRKKGFSGLEWAISIPGTLGGAIRGNAGAFGGEIKDFIKEVNIYDFKKDKFAVLSAPECDFKYRHSVFKENPNFIILEAKLTLGKSSGEEGDSIKNYLNERNFNQDFSRSSAGCVFKNVLWSRKDINKQELFENHSELKQFADKSAIPAGFLIDYLGFKGYQIGNAQISRKHGNFIINLGGTSAESVIMLIGLIKERVHRHYGIQLEEEIQIVL